MPAPTPESRTQLEAGVDASFTDQLLSQNTAAKTRTMLKRIIRSSQNRADDGLPVGTPGSTAFAGLTGNPRSNVALNAALDAAIPLSGTEDGKPVTGDVGFGDDYGIVFSADSATTFKLYGSVGELQLVNGDNEVVFGFSPGRAFSIGNASGVFAVLTADSEGNLLVNGVPIGAGGGSTTVVQTTGTSTTSVMSQKASTDAFADLGQVNTFTQEQRIGAGDANGRLTNQDLVFTNDQGDQTVYGTLGVIFPDGTQQITAAVSPPARDPYALATNPTEKARIIALFTSPGQTSALDTAYTPTNAPFGSVVYDFVNGDRYELFPNPDDTVVIDSVELQKPYWGRV